MREIDIAENAFHNGYEKGKTDGWIECCDYIKERLKELFNKGGKNNGKEMVKSGGDSCCKDDGTDCNCNNRNNSVVE